MSNKKTIIVLLTLSFLSLSCAARSAKTIATYKVGDKVFTIESDKEVTGLEIEYTADSKGAINFKLREEKSGTSADLLKSNIKMQELNGKVLDKLLPIIEQAGKTAITKGIR